MKSELFGIINSVKPLDKNAMDDAKKRQSRLAKPPGSLGVLEDLSVQLAGITGKLHNEIHDKRLLVFAADNGVIEEGVASAPMSVTKAQTINLTRRKTGGSVINACFGGKTVVVDVGVASDIRCPEVVNRKIAYGTKNICLSPAMTVEEAEQALLIGAETAIAAVKDGADVIGIGEMGIGNTTTSAALLCVLCGESPDVMVGRGGGINDEAFLRKKRVVARAIERAKVTADDPILLLSELGGFDIAAMAGAFIGGASMRIPVVVDGIISSAAACMAAKICPAAREYMVASHKSTEYGYAAAMKLLNLDPMFDLGMRLGEGSGCPIAFCVLEAACAVINDMATFDEADINDEYLDDIRDDESCFGGRGK